MVQTDGKAVLMSKSGGSLTDIATPFLSLRKQTLPLGSQFAIMN